MDADLVIAGGGPAGLATAIAARRRGLHAIVLERRPPPVDKACGEGILPPGKAWLAANGVVLDPAAVAPFSGVRYLRNGRAVEADLPDGGGLGVRRTALVAALRERAVALGATLRDGVLLEQFTEQADAVRVETSAGTLCAGVLVGADGLASGVRRAAGLERPARGAVRFGVRRHYRVAPWSDRVEVHFGDACEAYVTPLAPDAVGVALLFSGRGGFDRWLAEVPALRARLAGGEAGGPDRGAGPFRRAARARARGRVALVGDAAGYVDAITGEGLSHAFRAADLLADVLARGAPLGRYDARARALVREADRLTTLLLRLTRGARRRDRLVDLLARRPLLMERALAVLSGHPGATALTLRDLVRLAPLLV